MDFTEILRYVSDQLYPGAEKIVLITDNLNIHAPASLYKVFPPQEVRILAECFSQRSNSSCVSSPASHSAFFSLAFSLQA